MEKVKRVCPECGSEDVRLEAWNEWNVEYQGWRLSMDGGDEDRFWCIDCESTISTPDEVIFQISLDEKGERIWDTQRLT
tara:strand:+ start:52 stop:288 length:237 start_codon:yes stop_codon:yes gene_type:complete